MAEPLLKVEEIHTYYGDSHVIQGVSLEVNRGEVVCLLGRNGAGKTTTIRSIMGLTPPRRGRVLFGGDEITGLPTHEIVRRGVGFVPEDRRIFPRLTVLENLELAATYSRGEGKWTVERVLEEFSILRGLAHRKGGRLSGGEQQILAIARALLLNPEILLLDEPSEGLAPIIVEQLRELILNLKGEVTILLAEQNALFAIEVADRGYIIEKGRIAYCGDTESLSQNEEVKRRYLAL